MARGYRPDQDNAGHRRQFLINKKKILATQTICGICGKPVDFTKKYPHPMSPCIDHIIPVAKGGREKSDKLFRRIEVKRDSQIMNDDLPHKVDWTTYRAS